MAQSLTDWLEQSRFTVVEVKGEEGRVRVKRADGSCCDLACEGSALVADDGATGSLAALNPGDIVRLEGDAERPQRIVVLRRVWDELTSPEF